MLSEALTAAAVLVCLSVAWDLAKIARHVIRPYFSPVKIVPGPKSAHWFFGSMKQVLDGDPAEMHDKWEEEYGAVVRYKSVMQLDRLSIMDTRAMGHILGNTQTYQKLGQIRRALMELLGAGLLVVEGETHRRQRRIMNPAFSTPQIRALTEETFLDKSIEMRDIWLHKMRSNDFETSPNTASKIEILSWLNRMTLDIIGIAGFGSDFHALDETSAAGSELNRAMRIIVRPVQPSVLEILGSLITVLRIIPNARRREVKGARAVLDRVGKQMLEERKAAVRASAEIDADDKSGLRGGDLLSLLVRANMASDLPEASRMTDEEVLDQIPTVLLAGHETTSTAVAWMIYALSIHLDVQDKLRAELLACSEGDRPSMDTLHSLQYLDAVVRETMRLYAPVANTIRVAMHDDVIPTENEWVDRNGVRRSGIRVSKGDTIAISMLSYNRSVKLWGDEARSFKPERWFAEFPSTASSIPGVWSNLLSFLGGNRACIGWRFSVFEMKAIVYTLIRAFQFKLVEPPENIQFKSTPGVVRPHLRDNIEAGPQLSVWVTPVVDD